MEPANSVSIYEDFPELSSDAQSPQANSVSIYEDLPELFSDAQSLQANSVSIYEDLPELFSDAQSPPLEDKMDTPEKCHICKLEKNEDVLKCSICYQLFHRICLQMNLDDFCSAVADKDNWNCTKCLSDLGTAKCPTCLVRPIDDGNSECMSCLFPTAELHSNDDSMDDSVDDSMDDSVDRIQLPPEMLPPQIETDGIPPQVHPTVDTIMSVFVTHVNNPWDFYVIPKYSDWKMKLSKGNNCWEELTSLVAAMTQFYESIEPQASANWEVNQLVAVKSTPLAQLISSDVFGAADSKKETECGWYRAIVIVNPNYKGESATDSGQIRLYLYDIGQVLVPITGNVFGLSHIFLKIAPLARKCRLFGVSPVYTNWTREACVKFFEWTKCREGIVNVRAINLDDEKGMYHAIFSFNNNILCANEQYYTVDLRISKNTSHVPTSVEDSEIALTPNTSSSGKLPSQKDTSDGEIVFESIAQKLADDGLGLRWNLFPERPHIFRTVQDSAAVLYDMPFRPSEDLEKVKEAERQRLESYLRVTPKEEETEEHVLCLRVKNDPRLVKGTKDANEFSHHVVSLMRGENKKREEPQEVENEKKEEPEEVESKIKEEPEEVESKIKEEPEEVESKIKEEPEEIENLNC